MRSFAWLVLAGGLLACALAGGCDDSTVPLSKPDQAKADKALIGVWRQKDDGRTNYYHVGLLGGEAPKGLLRVVVVNQQPHGELDEPGQALVFPVELEGSTYLSMAGDEDDQIKAVRQEGWKPDSFDAYFIVKYRVEGDVLLVWPMDPDAKKRAIKAGRIKGEIKEGFVPRVRFTDSSENLRRLIASEGDKLFAKEPLRLERVR